MKYENLPEEKDCTGCGACVNVCPKDAITMKYSRDTGFSIPAIKKDKCVDCGLCVKTCPSLNYTSDNNKEPRFYAFCADDETRSVSSSGGMFSVIAEYVLSQNGYVCGAAFDNNMQLKHRIINSKDDLAPLRGSKYLQSDVNDCYKEIKKLLENNELVFFCGTPCQVAALKNVLNRSYPKLITADLLCHGTPSQSFFDKYLDEISEGKKVVDVMFRSKRFGWAYKGIIVKFSDGTEYVGTNAGRIKDPWVEGFIKNMMMRFYCYDCKFNSYPRQGDFTIGDLWHSDKLDPKSNDKKGTSFVFLNNSKAEELFNILEKSAKYTNNIKVENYSKIPNRVHPKAAPHSSRKRFINLIKTKSFGNAFKEAYYGHYDIGLVSALGNDNIGSILTYYGLYHTLTEMGYSVLPIERPLDSPLPVSDKAKEFNSKWLPPYAQYVQFDTIDDMRTLNEKCDQFVVGSDQIYLEAMSKRRNHFHFLQWVNDNKNKVGYSCSFGGPGARGSEEYYRTLKYYLNRFSFLSCREDDGVGLANNELQLKNKVHWCIDPVFLCDISKYNKLVNSVKKVRQKSYVGAYVLIPRANINKLLKKVHSKFPECNVEVIGNKGLISNEVYLKQQSDWKEYDYSESFPLENTLETIKNCEFFVTDSFHGVCFAIIFKKNFLVIPRDFPDRFTSLLGRLGLSDRIIKNDLSNLTEKHFSPIDYHNVYEKLNAEKAVSKTRLAECLKAEPFEYSDMDIIMKYIRKQNDEIKELKTQLDEIRKTINPNSVTLND